VGMSGVAQWASDQGLLLFSAVSPLYFSRKDL